MPGPTWGDVGTGVGSFLTEFLRAKAQRNMMQQQIEQQKAEEDRNEAMKLRLARLTNPVQSPEAQFPNYQNLPGVATGRLSPEQRGQIIPPQLQPSEAGMAAVNKLAAQRMMEAGESPEERAARVGKMTEAGGGFVGERGGLERKRMLEDIARLSRANRPDVAGEGVEAKRLPNADEDGFVMELIMRGYVQPTEDDWIPKLNAYNQPTGEKTLDTKKIFTEQSPNPQVRSLWEQYRRTGTIAPNRSRAWESDYDLGAFPREH